MYVVGRRAIPWILVRVARDGSQELFTLGVLAAALGIAFGSTALFGVSLALGAFFAGLVVGESDLSHRAAADALPLRDAFAVLFFVSVGMLFDPAILIESPERVLVVLAVVVGGKALAAVLIVLALRRPLRTGLLVAAGLAQVGEFSFILAELGESLGLLPEEGRNLILAGALLSITINPLLFWAISPVDRWAHRAPGLSRLLTRSESPTPPDTAAGSGSHSLRADAVICGYGRVGGVIGAALQREGVGFLVIEQNRRLVEDLRNEGIEAVWGDASNRSFLNSVGLDTARVLVAATDDPLVNLLVVEHARAIAPNLPAVVRAHSWAELDQLRVHHVEDPVWGEAELALEMTSRALRRLGVAESDAASAVRTIRAEAEARLARNPLRDADQAERGS